MTELGKIGNFGQSMDLTVNQMFQFYFKQYKKGGITLKDKEKVTVKSY
jgi:hypothetical protein